MRKLPGTSQFEWERPSGPGCLAWSDDADTRLERIAVTTWEKYFPLVEAPDLYLKFAELTDGESYLEFANAYGLLGLHAKPERRGTGSVEAETHNQWFSEVKDMKLVVRLWQALRDRDLVALHGLLPWANGLAPAEILRQNWYGLDEVVNGKLQEFNVCQLIRHDTSNVHNDDDDQPPPALPEVAANSLLGMMYWQFSHDLMEGCTLRRCATCGKPMLFSGRRKAGLKRGDCRFCSAPCRVHWNRKQRKKAKQFRDQGLSLKSIAERLGVDMDLIKKWLLTKGK
jgi:hypothetical protein